MYIFKGNFSGVKLQAVVPLDCSERNRFSEKLLPSTSQKQPSSGRSTAETAGSSSKKVQTLYCAGFRPLALSIFSSFRPLKASSGHRFSPCNAKHERSEPPNFRLSSRNLKKHSFRVYEKANAFVSFLVLCFSFSPGYVIL